MRTQLTLANLMKKGKFFTVWFTKKDGSVRKLNGRYGVHKHLKGDPKSVLQRNPNMLTVYDIQNKGYRNITLNRIIQLKTNGTTYTQQGEKQC